jgi:hypothetical protein
MTQKAPYNGANKLSIYALGITGVFGTLLYTFDKTITSKLTGHPTKGKFMIELDQHANDEAFNTFLKTYLTSIEVSTEAVQYEDNSIEYIVTGATTATTFGFIWYDGKCQAKRKLAMGAAVLSGNAGDYDTKSKGMGKTPVQLTALPSNTIGYDLTIGSLLFDTALATVATAITVTSPEYGTIRFETAP